MEGYHIQQTHRPKSPDAPRSFGGLAVGVKSALIKGVKFLKTTSSEFMWFKLCKKFFHMDDDIYVCNVYISPVNSSYSSQRDDIFDLLEHDIANFSKLGKCVLFGDFNARTSLDADFIVHDSDTFVDVNYDYVIDEPLLRRNVDTRGTDSHGKSLLQLCQCSGLQIVNGRVLGDLQGNFTCFNHWGSPSVIDYMVCHQSLFHYIDYFKVHDLNPFSIHCLISCNLKVSWSSSDNIVEDEIPLHDIPDKYIWNSNSSIPWCKALNDTDIKTSVNSLMLENNVGDTDSLVSKLYDIFRDAGQKAGLIANGSDTKRCCRKSTKKNTKKWYDVDCKKMYRNIKSLGSCIKKNPGNLTLIHQFRILKKKYKNLLNVKRSLF